MFARDIRVTSGAGANAEPVAEFTLATILYANKDVIWQRDVRRTPRDPSLRSFRSAHDVPVGNYDKTIGIVGASLIGRRVIDLLGAFPHLDVEGDGRQVAARLEMWREAQRKALGIERREDLPELPQEEINTLKRNIK